MNLCNWRAQRPRPTRISVGRPVVVISAFETDDRLSRSHVITGAKELDQCHGHWLACTSFILQMEKARYSYTVEALILYSYTLQLGRILTSLHDTHSPPPPPTHRIASSPLSLRWGKIYRLSLRRSYPPPPLCLSLSARSYRSSYLLSPYLLSLILALS